jgi:GT2 family glycosyltransferase
MMAAPRVTAVLPTFNAAGFVQQTMAALDAQTYPNLEILIGDDASTDDTPALLRSFAEARPNVRLILRQENVGWVANTNDLMRQRSGELMFFMPHDDLIEPTYVERLVAALAANPQAILAYSDVLAVPVDGKPHEVSLVSLDGETSAIRRALVYVTRARGWWVPHRGIFRAEAFDRIGGLQLNRLGEYSADTAWLLHMALLGQFVRVPEVLYHKVWKRSSLSLNWDGGRYPGGALQEATYHEVMRSDAPLHQKLVIGGLIRALGPVRWMKWRVGRGRTARKTAASRSV